MPQTVRPATTGDIPRLVGLLLMDAAERQTSDAILWPIANDAPAQIEKALAFALTSDKQPFRQFWQVTENDGVVSGVIHAMMLPVPPIYAGLSGDPGLILPDSFAAPDAPEGTVDTLVAAAETALADAGAQITLSSYVTGTEWWDAFRRSGYDPLTLYLARTDLGAARMPSAVRPAMETDVPGIVARSAENRQVLFDIDPFWETHPDADSRFANWMTQSLTLRDRDIMVMGASENLDGYAIVQPASRLHFPPAHAITGTCVIDDYYHRDLLDPAASLSEDEGATTLLRAAEAAAVGRGMTAAFVVCPAGWRSKVGMLEAGGYETAMVWSIKR